VRAIWEQEPRPENRIALSDEVDFIGHRRAQMIWRKSPMDKKTFTTMACASAAISPRRTPAD
jgi:hypothetical protein